MEKCVICGEDQDSQYYSGHNICTACADVMEDVMGEYFIRAIWRSEPKEHGAYLKYLADTTQYISDYKKLTSNTGKYTKDISERAAHALEESETPSRQRYFERMQEVLQWLEENPQFYHYYFKEYYVCPECGASLFENYEKHEVGEWLVISCSNCGTGIKKYYSPNLV